VKLKIIVLILVSITIFNSCRDISFNNPLDPNASKEAAKLIKIIDTTVSGIGDIDYKEGKIWKTTLSGTYMIDVESGTIIRSISGKSGIGIALFEGKLYVCNSDNNIQVYDSLSGELVKQILTSNIYPQYCCFLEEKLIVFDSSSKSIALSGLCTYNGGLLVANDQTDSIYSFSMGGEILKVFRSPATDIVGITSDDNIIYISNINGQIYKVSLP